MGKSITFTTVKSSSDNRKIKKDENGYYFITLGALNVFNSAGEYYTVDGVRDLFENKSSSLMRRLKSGYLKGETGHPNFIPGMTRDSFYARNMRIEETNTSHHIRDIVLTETNMDSGFGNDKIILVQGWIKPSGPNGDALEKDLENPDVNVAFSVRSFTKNEIVNGITVKRIVQLITWDWVTEPGISHASAWKTLGVESRDFMSMDIDELASEDGDINECFNCSLESNSEREIVKEIIDATRASDHTIRDSVLRDW